MIQFCIYVYSSFFSLFPCWLLETVDSSDPPPPGFRVGGAWCWRRGGRGQSGSIPSQVHLPSPRYDPQVARVQGARLPNGPQVPDASVRPGGGGWLRCSSQLCRERPPKGAARVCVCVTLGNIFTFQGEALLPSHRMGSSSLSSLSSAHGIYF